jgi:hypothetical protein
MADYAEHAADDRIPGRDPVEEFIVVETHDLTRDSRDACSHGFHMKTPELRC